MGAIGKIATESGRILIAEDDEALRRAFGRVLRRAGHEIIEARDGREAIALLDDLVEVVLSDIGLPDMDGVSLLRAVRTRSVDLPVILMTGRPQLESAVSAVEYGAFGYIAKPIEIEKLETTVARALKQFREDTQRRQLADSVTRQKTLVARAECDLGALLDGKYRVVRLIGSGGMGTVYEAIREDLGNMRVALKVIHPKLAKDGEIVARFRREAQVVAAIDHANIVKIFDFRSPDDGPAFLVMELLEGISLAQAIEHESPLAERRVAFIAAQALSALEAAHAANVIHRDLKPENIFLTKISGLDDVVKLLDFGVAKVLGDREPKLTQTGVVLGTPAYLAPETARGEKAGILADIYAAGCTMYEALTGREPFVGVNYNALLYAIQHEQVPPMDRCDVSREMHEIVGRAMSKNPSERFQSAAEMAAALAPFSW